MTRTPFGGGCLVPEQGGQSIWGSVLAGEGADLLVALDSLALPEKPALVISKMGIYLRLYWPVGSQHRREQDSYLGCGLLAQLVTKS